MFKKAYHVEHGEKEMYEVDANAAIRSFPDEWSDNPWPANKSEPKKEPAPPAKKYEAKHRGGGSYSIMGPDGEVLDKLSKDDAELFNAGSEADQENFIAAELAKRASS